MGLALELYVTPELPALRDKLAADQLDDSSIVGLAEFATGFASAEAFANNGGPYDEDYAWLWRWAQSIVAVEELGKAYSYMRIVLETVDPRLDFAIYGRLTLPCPSGTGGVARASQGYPYRYVPAEECPELLTVLNDVTTERLALALQALREEDPEEWGDHELHEYTWTVPVLQRIYRLATQTGSSVLIVID